MEPRPPKPPPLCLPIQLQAAPPLPDKPAASPLPVAPKLLPPEWRSPLRLLPPPRSSTKATRPRIPPSVQS
eukprot:11197143-Lingulodinium_polyedra.AAC.1